LHPIFVITKLEIQSLDDGQARELIARLCRATVSKLGIEETLVTWSGNQRAGDGGVDVRVSSNDDRLDETAIKKSHCVFQVKAEVFEPGKIASEMAPKNAIRPAIVELAELKGTYIIASTKDDVSDIWLKRRIAAMNACLDEHGLAGKVAVDFYDSRRIADWVEQHPVVVTWVRDALGKKQRGWKPYGPWAYAEDNVDANYIIDKRAKLFAPNSDEGSETLDAINDMRKAVMTAQAVRLLGLSGVGKTRLVQALFDGRIVTTEPALNPENVIYADVSDQPEPHVETMVEALSVEHSDCVVVIDNCSQKTHAKLVETLAKHKGGVRLLTVEYDIRDDMPEGTTCFRLEGSSSETICELLKARFSFLSQNDLTTLARVSEGNARLAFALASTSEVSGEIAQLRDEVLLERLFVQNKTESDELLRCGKVASLVYSFDFDSDESEQEMKVLADLAEVSVKTFRRNMLDLQSRSLIQARGQWRALLPHAVSNRLAALALKEIQKTELLTAFSTSATPRVGSSFARRLGFLHESSDAVAIVNEWLSPDGLLGNLRSLKIHDSKLFELIAPVSPESTLAAIERYANQAEDSDESSLPIGRFAGIARLIAYDEKLFDRCAKVLLTFSKIGANAGARQSLVDEYFRSLFFSRLSGTHATIGQREKVVRHLCFSSDSQEAQIGLGLLEASLEAHHFSSSLIFEFGLRRRNYGWHPKSFTDVTDWYSAFISIAGELGSEDSERGRRARGILGKKTRGLWQFAGMCDEIVSLAPALKAVDGWAEGWIAAKRILKWDSDGAEPEAQRKVVILEKLLAPTNLKESIIAKVLVRDVVDSLDEGSHGDTTGKRLRNAEDEAVSLGQLLAADQELLSKLLPRIANVPSRGHVAKLGKGVGQCVNDAQEILTSYRALLSTASQKPVFTSFLGGFISGWNEVDSVSVSAFLDAAIDDSVWGKIFPELQTYVTLDAVAVERILKSLRLGIAPVEQFNVLAYGGTTSTMDVKQVSEVIDAILERDVGGQAVAVYVLHMIVYGASDKQSDYRKALGKYCIKFIGALDWKTVPSESMNTSDTIETIVRYAVESADQMAELSNAFHRLLTYLNDMPTWHRSQRNNIIKPFLNKFTGEVLDLVFVADEDGSYEAAIRLLSNEAGHAEPTAMTDLTNASLLKWCGTSPERFEFAMQLCDIVSISPPTESSAAAETTLSSIVRDILNIAPNKAKMIELLGDRLYHMGSGVKGMKSSLVLLDSLGAQSDMTVATELTRAKSQMVANMEWWESIERKHRSSRSESFE